MRDYSKVSPRFWTGDTGRQLRKLGAESQVVAFYLFTCPSANMLGLYYLAMPTLCHETGRPLQGAMKALRSLRDANFAYYDVPSEHVWVPNMAREQIGETLKRKDNRHVAVLRELEHLRKTPFFDSFVTRYRTAFELEDVVLSKPLGSPSEDPLEPLRSQEQEQEQKQEQEQNKSAAPAAVVPPLAAKEWGEWLELRRKKRWPCTEITLRKQTEFLAQYPIEQQQQILDYSMRGPYQGLFEPRSGNGSGARIPARRAKSVAELEAEEEARNAQH